MTYDLLLNYYQNEDESWTDYRKPPYPVDAQVLGPFVREIMGLEGKTGIRYSKKSPNNIVKLEVDGKVGWAKLLHILKLDNPSDMVALVETLSEVEEEMLGSVFGQLGITRVIQTFKKKIISTKYIVSPMPHRNLPAWSMGLNSPSILILGIGGGAEAAEDEPVVRDMDVVYSSTVGNGDAMDINTDPSMI
ncbi:uncharacterized protein MELLADRAFT_67595 [Melampsora larici-populina 98AG31]|uniref:Uncharacterized protein n=1 Tax=Melampsora larici-populina (strain 98AG31 / pathotype 3-4-7) TaxID=747676 RepID=F4S3P9_MELLP|nr:uncharacterized protein MELLADRAFT_67595 [Melampsora larici-populina 98AG31]EGG00711.1 hypothetical protein MELLADRAFT_67595 [Melampsora larici-populina 98AG31]